MPRPDETLVRKVLAKDARDVRIRLCIEKAWDDLKADYVERPKWRRKSTTRAVMWEKSVEAVVNELDGDSQVKPVGHYDTISFVADDVVLFRLKKAATTLFSANYPTPLAGLFHVHRADLFGHDGHHRVEIVHVFDRFQTKLEWIGVVARDKKKVIWQYELPNSGASVTALRPSIPPTGSAADSVLRPAKPDADRKSDEEKQ